MDGPDMALRAHGWEWGQGGTCGREGTGQTRPTSQCESRHTGCDICHIPCVPAVHLCGPHETHSFVPVFPTCVAKQEDMMRQANRRRRRQSRPHNGTFRVDKFWGVCTRGDRPFRGGVFGCDGKRGLSTTCGDQGEILDRPSQLATCTVWSECAPMSG